MSTCVRTLDGDDGLLEVSLRLDGDATVVVGDHSAPLTRTADGRLAGTLRLPRIEKWWPHTHGKPALHAVKLRTASGEIDLGRVGFRSIAVDRDATARASRWWSTA